MELVFKILDPGVFELIRESIRIKVMISLMNSLLIKIFTFIGLVEVRYWWCRRSILRLVLALRIVSSVLEHVLKVLDLILGLAQLVLESSDPSAF